MKLSKVEVRNIGPFQNESFNMEGNKVLVGSNNSGKSSMLHLLDWVFNGLDDALIDGSRALTEVELEMLQPARELNRKRRFILLHVVLDVQGDASGSSGDNRALFKISFTRSGSDTKIVLSCTMGGLEEKVREVVWGRLKELLDSYSVVYINTARDTKSEFFKTSLDHALQTVLNEKLKLKDRGRPNSVSKDFRGAVSTINEVLSEAASLLWDKVYPLTGSMFAAQVAQTVSLEEFDYLSFATRNSGPRFSFSENDLSKVSASRIGAGVQSLIAIALAELSLRNAANKLLLLEEPEAFLHPTAQRSFAWQLFQKVDVQLIVTTHSSFVLAEARPSDVVIVKDYKFFSYVVDGVGSDRVLQEEKDRGLLHSDACNVMFSSSILLVEGPSEVAFFEGLRRRMYDFAEIDALSRMMVYSVGGNERFGPWIRLLSSYKSGDECAFSFLVCADGADAGRSVIKAFSDSGIKLGKEIIAAIRKIHDGAPEKLSPGWGSFIDKKVSLINAEAANGSFPLHFSTVDLEYSMTQSMAPETVSSVANRIGLRGVVDRLDLASKLGSKGGCVKPQDNKKAYIRQIIASMLPWGEVAPEVKALLWRWFSGACKGVESDIYDELSYG